MSGPAEQALASLLAEHTGQEFLPERRWRMSLSLNKILREQEIGCVDDLVARLRNARDPALERRVVEALVNNETYFFRDRAMFDQIAHKVVPEIAGRRAGTRRISIWSIGCSSGQEPLSLAMMFAEQEQRWAGWSIEIMATDVSESIVEVARKGVYSHFEIQRGLSVMQMLQWFDETPEGWKASDRLRRMVRFRTHNLLDEPPVPARFDLILCRNVMLYFDAQTRRRGFARIADALADDGWLMLGAGETVIGQTERLLPASNSTGLFRRAAPGVANGGRCSQEQTRGGSAKYK